MGRHILWFLVVLGSSASVAAACWLAVRAEPGEPSRPARRSQLAILLGCSVGLLAVALAYRVRAIAEVDADVVAGLVGNRNASLNDSFTVITTMGDVVPTFLIASLLALVYYAQTGRVRGLVLELIVVVQLFIQTSITNLFNDFTMTDLDPSVPIGGSGTIPSGSVARLLSILLVAATLWHGHSPRFERVLLIAAPTLVMIEIVSRLYLGRHLLVDIVAGLLLGVILTIAFRWLVRLGDSDRIQARLRRSATPV